MGKNNDNNQPKSDKTFYVFSTLLSAFIKSQTLAKPSFRKRKKKNTHSKVKSIRVLLFNIKFFFLQKKET